ncbi:RING/U-box superfamily protein [Rhynchospora pubera]|uniref:RING/U-box superfamily protein n=1 Tax=Rhynchospora pubera TaxID=906938 RepID=A0AAV8GHZ3_9POAL|nr:RING/U-box superfamily protein [Rhynchospora pubera]
MNGAPPPAAPPPPPHSTIPRSSPHSLNLLSVPSPPPPLTRIKLSDITPYDGACSSTYLRAVNALSSSLTRHNAAVLELASTGEDVAVMRCALESVRMYFKALVTGGGMPSRGFYVYRAGRSLDDGEISPPCMSEVFRHLGKAARTVLSAISRHLRLHTDAFSDLLDDTPLPPGEISSSRLVASFSSCLLPDQKMSDRSTNEIEKGFVTLIVSDNPGIQVCNPNGHWYLADSDVGPANLLLLTGKALSHCTAGLRPAALYRTFTGDSSSSSNTNLRASLMFKLMPKANAVLDCSRIISVEHCIPQSYQPISASQIMDELSEEDDMIPNQSQKTSQEVHTDLPREPSLLSVLSDSSSGAFLEDAMVVSCGHSFGGQTLKKVIEMARCAICHAEVDPKSLIPNIALRAAATVVKVENARRLDHIATLRKRKREEGEQINGTRPFGKDNGETAADLGGLQLFQGAQFPFSVNEKVLIKGNRRTPEKFVGREAVITSQSLNGWFLLKILDTGESVRLQYRSLQKLPSTQASNR